MENLRDKDFELNASGDVSSEGEDQLEGQDQEEEGELSSESEDEGDSILDEPERWEKEDVQTWLDKSDHEFDQEFESASWAGNFFKLEFLLKIKELQCNPVRQTIHRVHTMHPI